MSPFQIQTIDQVIRHPRHRLTVQQAKLVANKLKSGAWQPYEVMKFFRGSQSKYNPKPRWSISITAWSILEPYLYVQ